MRRQDKQFKFIAINFAKRKTVTKYCPKNTAKYLIMEVLKHKHSSTMAICNFITDISKEILSY